MKPISLNREKLVHMKATVDLGPPKPQTGPSPQLIDKARQALGGMDPLELMLDALREQAERRGIPHFDPVSQGGAELSSLLVREGGKPLSEGPTGFLTQAGLNDTWTTGTSDGLDTLRQDRQWVMGIPGAQGDAHSLVEDLRARHLKRAVEEWEFYLGQIHMRPVGQLSEAVELARLLALPQSALRVFMQSVAKETEFVLPATQPGQRPQGLEAFDGLHRLFAGEGENYRTVETLFHRLHLHLSAIQAAHKGKSLPPDPAALVAIRSQAALLPDPLRGVLEALSLQAQSQGEHVQRQALQTGMAPALDQCNQMTQGRYPFFAASRKEVLAQDFKRLFGKQGLLDEIRSGSSPSGLNTQTTASLNRAKRIQSLFFTGSEPSFNFEVRLKSSTPEGLSLVWEQGNQAHILSPNSTQALQWSVNGQASGIKLRGVGQSESLEFPGAWALYRLLDAGQIRSSENPENLSWRVQIQNQSFELEFISASALNPLRVTELRQFRCPDL